MVSAKILNTLLALPGIGNKTALNLARDLNGIEDVQKLVVDTFVLAKKENQRIPIPTDAMLLKAFKKAQEIQHSCDELDIQILGYFDENYPNQLRAISDPPLVIYLKGNANVISIERLIAIIGTREPTEFGKRAGFHLSQYFTESGFSVVSGLALGCDTEAHKASLANEGKTIAVLAHGLDEVYPKENRELSEDILAKGGCLVSEYPPGIKPFKSFFVERDRIQIGLSKALVVVESDLKGGSMHTVQFALEQSKKIGCLAGHPERLSNHPKTLGTYNLIDSGKAFRLSNKQEIDLFISAIQGLHSPYISAPPNTSGTFIQGKLF